MDPKASRETLDHSIMYIFAVALEDGSWHHIKSYTPDRANRKSTINLWQKIKTFESSEWTKKYHNPDPRKKSFGGRVIIKMKDGSVIEDQREVADAHPSGLRPFRRANYIEKFKNLTEGLMAKSEVKNFLNKVQNLKNLKYKDLVNLNPKIRKNLIDKKSKNKGIF